VIINAFYWFVWNFGYFSAFLLFFNFILRQELYILSLKGSIFILLCSITRSLIQSSHYVLSTKSITRKICHATFNLYIPLNSSVSADFYSMTKVSLKNIVTMKLRPQPCQNESSTSYVLPQVKHFAPKFVALSATKTFKGSPGTNWLKFTVRRLTSRAIDSPHAPRVLPAVSPSSPPLLWGTAVGRRVTATCQS